MTKGTFASPGPFTVRRGSLREAPGLDIHRHRSPRLSGFLLQLKLHSFALLQSSTPQRSGEIRFLQKRGMNRNEQCGFSHEKKTLNSRIGFGMISRHVSDFPIFGKTLLGNSQLFVPEEPEAVPGLPSESRRTFLLWTKTSGPPESGAMKP